MCVLLITRLLRGVGRWARKPVNHTSWVAVVTPTDRPKSVRNRCLIELFLWRCLCCHCPFDISVGVGAFVIGLSQISFFLSLSAYFSLKCISQGGTRKIIYPNSPWATNNLCPPPPLGEFLRVWFSESLWKMLQNEPCLHSGRWGV